MKEVPSSPRRKNIRLKNYDYTSAGYYFVTICTEKRKCLFGNIVGGKMELSPLGETIRSIWVDMPEHYPGVAIDSFIVMPNHLHGIVILNVGAGPCARPGAGQARGPAPTLSLSDVIQRFKSFSDRCYRRSLSGG
jgi:hypothetical protein